MNSAGNEAKVWSLGDELAYSRRDIELPHFTFDVFDGEFFDEWSLHEMRQISYRSRVGLPLSGCGESGGCNTGLIVFDGVRAIRATGLSRPRELTAWIVGATTTVVTDETIEFSIGDMTQLENEVAISCARVEVRLGFSREFATVPPDFVEGTPQGAMSATPNWGAPFDALYAAARTMSQVRENTN